ncbi:MAG: DMT family transporter [Bacillota bacterium]
MNDGSSAGTGQAHDPSASTRATLAAVGAIVLWCWSGVCYAAGGRAVGAMPYLSLVSAVGVLTVILLHLAFRRPIAPLFRLPLRLIVAGLFGVAVYSILLGWAMGIAQDKDLGAVMLLNYLWPIWIVLLGMLLLPVRLRVTLVLAGALLGFLGVAVAQGSIRIAHRPIDFLPHAMTLTASFLWALYSVLLRRWNIPAEQGGSTFHFTVCSLLAGGLALKQGAWQSMAALDARSVGWILFGGIGPIGLAYYGWEIGVKRGSVHLIALLAYFIPIGSAVLIGLFFHAAMSPRLILGAVMIAIGAWLGHRATRNPSE